MFYCWNSEYKVKYGKKNVVKTVIFTEMGDKAPSTKKCDKDQ